MNIVSLTSAICALGVASLILPANSYAAPRIAFVSASFKSTEASGCISNEAFIYARTGNLKPAGSQPEVFVTISRINDCTQQFLLGITGSKANLGQGHLKVDDTLDSASLDTKVKVTDTVSNHSYNIELHLTWTATDEAVQIADTHYLAVPGQDVNLNSKTVFTSRPALATGTIAADTISLTFPGSDDATVAAASP